MDKYIILTGTNKDVENQLNELNSQKLFVEVISFTPAIKSETNEGFEIMFKECTCLVWVSEINFEQYNED